MLSQWGRREKVKILQGYFYTFLCTRCHCSSIYREVSFSLSETTCTYWTQLYLFEYKGKPAYIYKANSEFNWNCHNKGLNIAYLEPTKKKISCTVNVMLKMKMKDIIVQTLLKIVRNLNVNDIFGATSIDWKINEATLLDSNKFSHIYRK